MKSVLIAATAFLCGAGAGYLLFRCLLEPNEDPPIRSTRANDVRVAKPDDDISTKDAFEVPVPAGHIPVVIEVEPSRIVSSILRAYTNRRVNVVTTKHDPGSDKSVAVILLKDILVLEDKLEKTVTLALKPEDVPILERAKREGVLALMLRPFSDKLKKDVDDNAYKVPLPPGHMPVVVEAGAESLAGGRPTNPRYNVIISKHNDQGKVHAAILLENILMLDERDEVQTDENGLRTPRRLVTLALKPDDIPKLERAKREGVITLALPRYSGAASSEVARLSIDGFRDESTNRFNLPVPAGHKPIVLEVLPQRIVASICWPIVNSRVRLLVIKRDPDTGKPSSAILADSILVLDDRFETQIDETRRAAGEGAVEMPRVKNLITVAAKLEDIPKLEDAQRTGTICLGGFANPTTRGPQEHKIEIIERFRP